MASATWRIRLLKLDLARVETKKTASHKSRPRRLRPRLTAEQLEDRTLPSGGMHLLEPAVHHAPTPPPQGPAAQGSPSAAHDGNPQWQDNPSSTQGQAAHGPASPASTANGQGQENGSNPHGPIGQESGSSSNNGQGHGHLTSDKQQTGQEFASSANNNRGEDNSPPPHGPAGKGLPSSANSGNGQGKENPPNLQGPAGQGPGSAANNGQGHGNSESDQEQAEQGSGSLVNNGQEGDNSTSGQGPAGQEPEGDQLSTSDAQGSAAQGYKSSANNAQGQNTTTPEATANGQGNGNGQGESENNSTEAQNSQSKLVSGTANREAAPQTSQSNGPASENSQGTDSGQVIDNVQAATGRSVASTSAAVSSSIDATSAEIAQGSSAARSFAEALVAEESIALGVLAEQNNAVEALAASVRRGSPPAPSENEEVSVPEVGSPSSGGGMPTLIASSPMPAGGAFGPFVTGLQKPDDEEGFKPLVNYLSPNNLDRLFLEWWDEDQMLFPDTMPPFDEMLFPEVMPQLDDMLLPNDILPPSESSSGEGPSGEDVSLDLGRLGLVPTAAPTAVRWEDVLASDAPAKTQTDEVCRFVPTPPPVPANQWLESASATSAPAEEPVAGENLRPYHIALGMMPFLVAFGYSPSSLRDHVHEGQRVWKRLRDYLRL
jgi:hypothetical protein